jgi:hypothetical protein
MIGVNDLSSGRFPYAAGTCGGADNQDCLRAMVTNFNSNWDGILAEVSALIDESTTAVRTLNVVYPSAGLDQMTGPPPLYLFGIVDPYLQQMNDHVATTSAQYGFAMTDIHAVYNGLSGAEDPIAGGYVSPETYHPTSYGALVIADQLRLAGYLPLVKPCGDVNDDTHVNVLDLLVIAQNANSGVYSELNDVNADININVIDLLLVARQNGAICP